ncbi:MAG: ComEA family DNA-binding protein [bacterium]
MKKLLLILLIMFSSTVIAAESININTANAQQLAQNLNGIGPSKASAIVQYREQNGPFTNIEQLQMVKGIGPMILEKNKERIKIEP